MTIKKSLNKKNPKNTIAHVVFRGVFNEKYECVGVLARETDDLIRIAFNAKNDNIVDYIDIKRSNAISINILDPSNIEKI